MCTKCGCATSSATTLARAPFTVRPVRVVDVVQDLLAANDALAAKNRARFEACKVLVINLMSSPGAGKTALLEATIDALKGRYRIGVIEGDLATENDAQRIRAHGVPAVQITTGTACHLDAALVRDALTQLDIDNLDILFIENVGNLVCPAGFDLGEGRRVTLLCATEGDDKPAKYPVIFRAADLVVITKSDLLEVLEDFDPARALASLRALGRDTPLVRTASRRRIDIQAWLAWLEAEVLIAQAATMTPRAAPLTRAQG
jgi:hydrogenase nickel incorporation protein HypB